MKNFMGFGYLRANLQFWSHSRRFKGDFLELKSYGSEEEAENKKWQTDIAPLQPPTLATFRSWGSSAGAGRADLPLQIYVI